MKKLFNKLEVFLFCVLTAITFLSFLPITGYVLYFLFVEFSAERVFVGAISLYILLQFNKNLRR